MGYSMSHCCIENAAGALEEAITKFKERQNDVQSNPYELRNIKGLYDLCKEYVEEYEQYDEDKEAYIRNHSEPEDDEDE